MVQRIAKEQNNKDNYIFFSWKLAELPQPAEAAHQHPVPSPEKEGVNTCEGTEVR